jgi:hypothetical protein
MEEKLNWKNLLRDKCPQCGKNLRFLLVERIWQCNSRRPKDESTPRCDFVISDPRKNEISCTMVGMPSWQVERIGGIEAVSPDAVKAKINEKRAEPWKYKAQ